MTKKRKSERFKNFANVPKPVRELLNMFTEN